MTETEELISQARDDYGELIKEVSTWPPGLGIDVLLIGGEVIQYLPGMGRHVVDQPSLGTRVMRRIAWVRGALRRSALKYRHEENH